MRTRLIHGDSNFNNSLTLEEGSLSIDTEKKALRFHLGGIQGGFEILGQRAYTPPPYSGPGSQELLHGDEDLGFYGEVPVSELIDGESLASAIGLSAGRAFNTTQPWLKFSHQGSILYVAKRPYRYNLSWDHIHARGAVFGTVVQIGDLQYRVRLLTGGNASPASSSGGEWNQLLYPVHQDDPDQLGWGVGYTNADLVVGSGDGRRAWCQERAAHNSSLRVFRGDSSLSDYAHNAPSSGAYTSFGWRPVLEFQPPEG